MLPGTPKRRADGALSCYWRLAVHDQGGTHRARCLSLTPVQTVEACPGASLNGTVFQARTSCGNTLSNGGSVPSAYSPHTYSPRSKGRYTRREAQQPRPRAALQPRALAARTPVLAARTLVLPERTRAAEPLRPEAGERRQRPATAAQVRWKHAPLPRVPRVAGQGWRQR